MNLDRIVETRLSPRIVSTLRNIFAGHSSSYFQHDGSLEEYLLALLQYMERKAKENPTGDFHNELMKVAIGAANSIDYRIQLDSDPCPIQVD